MTNAIRTCVLTLVLCGFSALSGCPSGTPTGTPCDDDMDCPDGEFCAPGGCDYICVANVDCLEFGAEYTCDERGRCVAPMPCVEDADCADEVFCNGFERCAPEEPGADSDGCVSSTSACEIGWSCSEADDTCAPCGTPDADGDMFESAECGGEDCDDTDPMVHPARPEFCDDDGVDEDCRPTTFGVRDEDGDGYTSFECFNVNRATGEVRRGDDCDDADAANHRANDERCDHADNDCDGSVDEDAMVLMYPDLDGDLYGAAVTPRLVCEAEFAAMGWRPVPGDCDDGDIFRNPGIPDGPFTNCDGVDNNCDGVVDRNCACRDGSSTPCGSDLGRCQRGVAICVSGMEGTCGGSYVPASTETCSMVGAGESGDEDCDGRTDEGVGCSAGATASCVLCNAEIYGLRFFTISGTRTCGPGCTPGSCIAPPESGSCTGLDHNCNGVPDDYVPCRRAVFRSQVAGNWLHSLDQNEAVPPYSPEPSRTFYVYPTQSIIFMVPLVRCFSASTLHWYALGEVSDPAAVCGSTGFESVLGWMYPETGGAVANPRDGSEAWVYGMNRAGEGSRAQIVATQTERDGLLGMGWREVWRGRAWTSPESHP